MNLKEKTVVIDNKTYRYSKIMILESNNKTGLVQFGQSLRKNCQGLSEMVVKFQHLYFLSNDKIKTSDWVLDLNDNSIFQIQIQPNTIINKYKKIIATTDLSLAKQVFHKDGTPTNNYSHVLPQPSQQFIQKFIEEWNKGEKIEECLVEYEGIGRMKSGREYCPVTCIPKVTKGEITIKKIKDNFTLKEVNQLCRLAFRAGEAYRTSTHELFEESSINEDKWIEQNL